MPRFFIYIAIFLMLLVTSCDKFRQVKLVTNQKSEAEIKSEISKLWEQYLVKNYNDTEAQNIFIVTNRNQNNGNFSCKENAFGAKINNDLQFGICEVNVPKNHDSSEIKYTKDGRQSSYNYYKTLDERSFNEADLINKIKDSNRTPLIFVHGFNVKYSEAILRAAQIAYDLKYQGLVILFTWPAGSGGDLFETLNQTYDNNLISAKESVANFRDFIARLQSNNIVPNIAVHSMGHQIVLPALAQLGAKNPQVQYVNELVLSAPDFNAQSFKDLSANIKTTAKRITIYCSYNDKAMTASKLVNSGDRLGACNANRDFDVINVSLLNTANSGLGHSYYSSKEVLSDVVQLLIGISADKRFFVSKSDPNSTEKYFLRN